MRRRGLDVVLGRRNGDCPIHTDSRNGDPHSSSAHRDADRHFDPYAEPDTDARTSAGPADRDRTDGYLSRATPGGRGLGPDDVSHG
jgi:hypothetical protein